MIHIYLMFLSRDIDIKLCQNYTKIYIYETSITSQELPIMRVQYTGNVIQTEIT